VKVFIRWSGDAAREFAQLFLEINKWLRQPLEHDVLLPAVLSKLPKFDAALGTFRATAAGRGTAVMLREDREVLDEILLIVRDMQSQPKALAQYELPPPSAPLNKGWQQLPRRLDGDLAEDRISVEDYRRLRDEPLAQVGSTPRGALPR